MDIGSQIPAGEVTNLTLAAPAARRRSVDLTVAAAIAGLVVGLAGCSSGSSLPAAGTGSPTAAASGFLQGLASSGLSGVCDYLLPSLQATCTAESAGSGYVVKITGLKIGNDIVVGDEALVVFEASAFCAGPTTANTTCQSNSNPNAGLPTAANFASVYSAAASFNSSQILALEEQNNQWYVIDNQSSGTSGSTGTPTTGAPTGATGSTSTGTTGSTSTSTTGTTGSTSTGTTGPTGPKATGTT